MKRKTVFIGLGILALLLFVGIAAGRITEEAKETMQDRRGGMRGFGGKGNGEFERGHGMHGPTTAFPTARTSTMTATG